MYKNYFFILLFVLIIAGCNTSSPLVKEDAMPKVSSQQFEGITWKLVSFGLTRKAVPQDAYLIFKDGHYSGKGGCNKIFGSYTTEDSKIRLKEGMSTMMACPQMALERELLQRLVRVESYAIDDEGRLELRANRECLLRFTKQ